MPEDQGQIHGEFRGRQMPGVGSAGNVFGGGGGGSGAGTCGENAGGAGALVASLFGTDA
jgi:hypothetical protein